MKRWDLELTFNSSSRRHDLGCALLQAGIEVHDARCRAMPGSGGPSHLHTRYQ